MKDQLLEIREKYNRKREEYKQAVDRHEFLEQMKIREELENLKMQWDQLVKDTG
ncbi:MAG: hypothetical protein M0Z65_01550 [Firmicutes bacterium]|uniref:Uncharacterized protein n=1 Tax=Melghirimyces thermohalophilus TaxID=1236220 RepID=A0A1G6QGI0_9BACL|nr:hypothetical protein [Melghirimyces thermohalophilus]MDA8351883.1 hypothetical protein [Bacillota bacterium]SDC90787.1 hypothetical protein SAMN04488112_12128 [Melghirimyces thermohalophilus]